MSKGRSEVQPQPPKRPTSAYIKFFSDKCSQGVKITTTEAGKLWGTLGDQEKNKYLEAHAKELDIFNKEKEAYEKKYGPFQRKKKEDKNEISKPEREKGAKRENSRSRKMEEPEPKKSMPKGKVEKSKGKVAEKSKGKSKKWSLISSLIDTHPYQIGLD